MSLSSLVGFLGGLAFFLFGMTMMGEALKRVAGNKMQLTLGRLASTRIKGIALGAFVTAIIQSSSATSVMVVSFASSGIMTLTQAISVVMGANIGTTATGWILTLADLDENAALGSILSTTFIFGVVAIIGIIFFLFSKNPAGKNTGVILVSLSVLMSGMKSMSNSMEVLQASSTFMRVLTFTNPVLFVFVGIIATAIIQSCSASIGILQAMSAAWIIPYSVAIPLVIGMSIGACVPVLISGLTANKDGKRVALSYLYFNLLGGAVSLVIFAVAAATPQGSAFLGTTASSMNIAVVNSLFKVFSVVILYPFMPQLEKLVRLSIKDAVDDEDVLLDEMLLNYPAQALERSAAIIQRMAEIAEENIRVSMELMFSFDKAKFKALLQRENKQDEYEDKLIGFLVKLNAKELRFDETQQSTKYLRCVTDLERISDHSENVARLAKDFAEDDLHFSPRAKIELSVYAEALNEIVSITSDSLVNDNLDSAYRVEPLEQVVDNLTEILKQNHVARLQKGKCSLKTGFIFNDCINNLERAADHCSNIAVLVIESHDRTAEASHNYLRTQKQGENELYSRYFGEYEEHYTTKYNEMMLEHQSISQETPPEKKKKKKMK